MSSLYARGETWVKNHIETAMPIDLAQKAWYIIHSEAPRDRTAETEKNLVFRNLIANESPEDSTVLPGRRLTERMRKGD